MGGITAINRFKDELKAAIESKTGWGKNQLMEVVETIASKLSDELMVRKFYEVKD
jgi:hypothetical protein